MSMIKLETMSMEELREHAVEERRKRLEIEGMLEDVFVIAKKQEKALYEFIDDYEYRENPCLRAASDYSLNKARDEHSRRSYKWIYDYERIVWLITVARDYGLEIYGFEQKYEQRQENDVNILGVKEGVLS